MLLEQAQKNRPFAHVDGALWKHDSKNVKTSIVGPGAFMLFAKISRSKYSYISTPLRVHL